jgi:hypothetical protein
MEEICSTETSVLIIATRYKARIDTHQSTVHFVLTGRRQISVKRWETDWTVRVLAGNLRNPRNWCKERRRSSTDLSQCHRQNGAHLRRCFKIILDTCSLLYFWRLLKWNYVPSIIKRSSRGSMAGCGTQLRAR